MNEQRPKSRGTGRRPKVVIAAESLERLELLAERSARRNPALAGLLMEELGRARVVPAAKLPAKVVAIDRAVTYRDETTDLEKTVTLVFPEEADIACGRVSILTPIAVALIGLSEGDRFHWHARDGKRRTLSVLRVTAAALTEGQGAG